MGFWDSVKKEYKSVDKSVGGYLPGGVKPSSEKTTTTTTKTAPKQQPSITAVDVGSSSQDRVGGYTVVGSGGSSSGGSSSGGGSSGSAYIPQSSIIGVTQQQVQELESSRGRDTPIKTQQPQQATQFSQLSTIQKAQATQQGTMMNYQQQNLPQFEVQTEPYIKEEVTGYEKNKFGRQIPITKTTYVDPTGLGVQKERPATAEEKQFLKDQRRAKEFEERNLSQEQADANIIERAVLEPIKHKYRTSAGVEKVRNILAEPIIKDTTLKNIELATSKTLQQQGGIFKFEPVSKFIAGVATSLIPKTKGELVRDTAIYIGSAGLGAGLRVGTATASKIGTKVAPKLASKIGKSKVIPYTKLGVGAGLTGVYSYSVGKQIAMEKDYTKKGSIAGKSAKEFVLFGAGFKAGGRAVEKTLLTKENILFEGYLGKTKSTFKEVQQPIITDKGTKIKSYFQIKTQRPPYLRISEKTTGLREFLGRPPKERNLKFEIKPPTISDPLGRRAVYIDDSFVLKTSKVRKTGKLGEPKFSVLSGEQINIQKLDLYKLDKVSRYTLAETIGKGKLNTIIKPKDVSKFIKENEVINLGTIKTYEPLKPLGKKTSLRRVTSLITEKAIVNDAQKFKVVAGFKDVSKPYARAIGRVDILKGEVLRLKPIDRTTKKSYLVKPADIKKTPLQTTFKQEQIGAIKYAPKVKTPKIRKTTQERIYQRPSIFSISRLTKKTTRGSQRISQRQLQRYEQSLMGGARTKSRARQKETQINKVLSMQKIMMKEKTLQKEKTMQKQKQLQRQRLSSKQLMKLTYVPKTPTKTIRTYVPPPKKYIGKKPPFFYFKMPKSKELGISEKQLMGRDVKVLAQGFTEKALGIKKLRGI